MPFKDSFQQEAIQHGNGPALILAGPGSGKTFVLTHHINFLIDSMGVSPNQILVITFTKDAAVQMKQRFNALAGSVSDSVTFSTFHAFYFGLLKQYSGVNYKIISNERKWLILSKLSNDINSVEDLSNEISRFKSLISGNSPGTYFSDDFLEILTQYNEILKTSHEIDYDDILLYCRNMLLANPVISKLVRNRFKYILVDEFQDINEIQYDILKLISEAPYNFFAVGDDDQSIYGFRGADGRIMERFRNDFSNVKIYELKYNYRCHEMISSAASVVISENLSRQKNYIPICPKNAPGNHFFIKGYDDRNDQKREIKRLVSEKLKEGKSCVILCRTNKDLQKYRELFESGFKDDRVYERLRFEIAGDIAAYAEFSKKKNRLSILRILNKPDRMLQSSLFTDDTVDLDAVKKRIKNVRFREEIDILKRHFQILSKATPSSFLVYLNKIIRYENFIKNKYPDHLNETERILREFEAEACKFKNVDEFTEMLSQVSFKEDPANKQGGTGLSFLTFHGSKGLEFDCVFIPDVNEGRIPGRISFEQASVEEERRLFFVAMTRASDELYISYIKNEESGGTLPSRFLKKLL